ncbi:MAG: biopolymer transporter ExbD [Kiritimatiellaeota bacterium]|nr:biopolymer transporter ExbD [Kiritimatiellota bacterium]
MISLMDVVFLVLIFFVYSTFSMSVHRALKVSLPSAKGAAERGEAIMITVTADDELHLNKQPMPMDEIIPATLALWEQQGQPVLISADRSASLGVGIELLGKLKDSGIGRIAFQVAESEQPGLRKEASGREENN